MVKSTNRNIAKDSQGDQTLPQNAGGWGTWSDINGDQMLRVEFLVKLIY